MAIAAFDLSAVSPVYPGGAPLYWMNEVTGKLRWAIERYAAGSVDPRVCALTFQYVRYWLNAPVWAVTDAMSVLRADVILMDPARVSREEIRGVLDRMLDLGIDPL